MNIHKAISLGVAPAQQIAVAHLVGTYVKSYNVAATVDRKGLGTGSATLLAKSPQTFTLVEADASPEAGAPAILDIQIPPGNGQIYRALPVTTLFGEVPGKSGCGC